MKHHLAERLKICFAIEWSIANIYRNFAEMFPEAADLWGGLAMEEDNHASILAIGSRYADLGTLPDVVVPDSLSHMKSTLGLVQRMSAEIQEGNIPLGQALAMSLKLEQTLEEGYLVDVMTAETPSEVVARLQKLLTDTKSHIIKIQDYMRSRG